jgi:hypothetical protein
VWPHLEIEAFTTQDGANVLVENTGLGPAVVKSITVALDDKPQLTWRAVLDGLLGDSTRAHSNNTVFEHGIRPGDRVTLLGLPAGSTPVPFWEKIGRVRIRICYASVFDEAWMVEDRLGTSNHWQRVESCPAQRTGDDF